MYTDIFSDDAIFTFADTFGIDSDPDYYDPYAGYCVDLVDDAIADLNSDDDF